jgi:hypothetical protein
MYRNAENFNKYDNFLLPVNDPPSLSLSSLITPSPYSCYLHQIVRGMLNKWKKERGSFSNGKRLSVAQVEELPVLTAIPDAEKTEVNSMMTDLRKSISDALDYFSRIDKAGVFASPVCRPFHPLQLPLSLTLCLSHSRQVSIPGYTNIIKDPRDLSSIRVNSMRYRTIDQFESDIQLMFQNCAQFNHQTGNKYYVKVRISPLFVSLS